MKTKNNNKSSSTIKWITGIKTFLIILTVNVNLTADILLLDDFNDGTIDSASSKTFFNTYPVRVI